MEKSQYRDDHAGWEGDEATGPEQTPEGHTDNEPDERDEEGQG